MEKKYLVFVLNFNLSDSFVEGKIKELEDLLNSGYSIIRCDCASVASSGGGQSGYHSSKMGTMVYVLQNLRSNGN